MDAGTAAMMGGAAGLMTGVLLAEPHYGGGWYGPPCGPTVIGACMKRAGIWHAPLACSARFGFACASCAAVAGPVCT